MRNDELKTERKAVGSSFHSAIRNPRSSFLLRALSASMAAHFFDHASRFCVWTSARGSKLLTGSRGDE
jgi:hypothetical protein